MNLRRSLGHLSVLGIMLKNGTLLCSLMSQVWFAQGSVECQCYCKNCSEYKSDENPLERRGFAQVQPIVPTMPNTAARDLGLR